MALPQQGTETSTMLQRGKLWLGVNGLTPTGDGNYAKLNQEIGNLFRKSVNGLTPTGDGNVIIRKRTFNTVRFRC